MKIKTSHIIIIVLAIVIILLSTCNSNPVITKAGKTITRVEHSWDTVYIEHTNTITKTKHDTVIEYYNDFNQLMREFHYEIKDSLLDGSIIIFNKTPIDSLVFDYKAEIPVITEYIRDSVYQEGEIKSFMSFGGQIIGGGNYFGVAPMLTYSHKKGNNYLLGYDVLNGNVMVGFTKKISFRRKK